jgi:hypothetical protein
VSKQKQKKAIRQEVAAATSAASTACDGDTMIIGGGAW